MAKYHVTATVNGDAVEYLCEPEQTLLDVLRDELDMTGKQGRLRVRGLRRMQRAADVRLVCACLVLGAEMQGRAVETIEGMADGAELHPLQQKFLEHAALQCGVCTPGFLVAAKALLDRGGPERDRGALLARGQSLPVHRLRQDRAPCSIRPPR